MVVRHIDQHQFQFVELDWELSMPMMWQIILNYWNHNLYSSIVESMRVHWDEHMLDIDYDVDIQLISNRIDKPMNKDKEELEQQKFVDVNDTMIQFELVKHWMMKLKMMDVVVWYMQNHLIEKKIKYWEKEKKFTTEEKFNDLRSSSRIVEFDELFNRSLVVSV